MDPVLWPSVQISYDVLISGPPKRIARLLDSLTYCTVSKCTYDGKIEDEEPKVSIKIHLPHDVVMVEAKEENNES
jgi:hypothetical protein